MYIKVLQGNIDDSAFVDTGIASQFPAILPLRPKSFHPKNFQKLQKTAILPLRPQELGLPSKA